MYINLNHRHPPVNSLPTYFGQHKKEFYFHGFVWISLFLLIFSISFVYSEAYLYLATLPLMTITQSSYFIVTNLCELFHIKLYLSFIISSFVTFFLFLFQFWFFLAPSLVKQTNKWILHLFSLFLFLMSLSLKLIYNWLIPQMWSFFLNFNTTTTLTALTISFEPNLYDYILLLSQTIFYMLLILQYPFGLFLILRCQILTVHQFIKFRKLFYIKFFILTSLLTPPDLLSQSLIFGCWVGCIELIIFYFLFQKYKWI